MNLVQIAAVAKLLMNEIPQETYALKVAESGPIHKAFRETVFQAIQSGRLDVSKFPVKIPNLILLLQQVPESDLLKIVDGIEETLAEFKAKVALIESGETNGEFIDESFDFSGLEAKAG